MPARRIELSPNDALALIEYDRRVFERFVRRVRGLPGTGAMRKRGIGHESVFRTLVHILNVHEVWLVYIVPGRSRELRTLFEDASRHPTTWRGFDAYASKVWAGVEATVRGLTPRSLGRRAKAPWMPGTYSVRDVIYQTTLEEAHHLGEIIGALWQDDVESPPMTWIDVRRAAPRRARKRARTRRVARGS